MLKADTSEVREALIAAGITGPHQSHSRSGSISKIHSLLEGLEPEATFGLPGLDKYSAGEILGFMAELTGCSTDIADTTCEDFIDPERTMAGLLGAGRRLRDEARRGGSLLAVTGHPTGMLEFYVRVMDAFVRAGGKQVRLREGEQLPIGSRGQTREVRYVCGVGCVADWGSLRHTHSPSAMEALLQEDPWPDLVLGDHGFAGAALAREIPVVAVVDINDHALAIAAAEHRDITIVPMDDNRPPRLYEPAWTLVERIISGDMDE
jgi:hypothetical protein